MAFTVCEKSVEFLLFATAGGRFVKAAMRIGRLRRGRALPQKTKTTIMKLSGARYKELEHSKKRQYETEANHEIKRKRQKLATEASNQVAKIAECKNHDSAEVPCSSVEPHVWLQMVR